MSSTNYANQERFARLNKTKRPNIMGKDLLCTHSILQLLQHGWFGLISLLLHLLDDNNQSPYTLFEFRGKEQASCGNLLRGKIQRDGT